jgi:cytochrome c-type biogenesis protein
VSGKLNNFDPGLASNYLEAHAILITYISVGLLIAMGLYMLLSVIFPKINYECHLPVQLSVKSGYMRSFAIGAVYSFLHSPCSTPSLLAVAGLVMASDGIWVGGSLLFFYFLGYGIPFLLAGLAFGALMPFFKKVSEYRGMLYATSGVLLIAAGFIILLRIM